MVDRKLPGKQIWSGRRRASTRVSGFHSHKSATGGHYRTGKTTSFELKKGEKINIFFEFGEISSWLGFGGYLWHEGVIRLHFPRLPIKHYSRIHPSGCWSKFGSMWELRDISYKPDQIEMVIEAVEDSMISFYNLQSGSIQHEHLDNARAKLLANMHQFSPEAHFFTNPSPAKLRGPRRISDQISILLKQCNRCARYLPINYDFNNPTAERYHLAFTNHCTAQHRIPCKHAGFGLLKSRSGEDDINLTYGFQLECRFCKKFEVNAAHNPQRTSAQMKEDGARRRHIEILLEHIYEGTPQLVYKEQYGSELSDDIWNNFNRKCFKCSKAIDNPKDMHLDHTRPLMMLWPLDHTATCLCADCNIQKTIRPDL